MNEVRPEPNPLDPAMRAAGGAFVDGRPQPGEYRITLGRLESWAPWKGVTEEYVIIPSHAQQLAVIDAKRGTRPHRRRGKSDELLERWRLVLRISRRSGHSGIDMETAKGPKPRDIQH